MPVNIDGPRAQLRLDTPGDLKVGDLVFWYGFDGGPEGNATVIEIQLCPWGQKYGRAVESVPWVNVWNYAQPSGAVLTLRRVGTVEDDVWAYGDNVIPVAGFDYGWTVRRSGRGQL